MPLLLLSRLLLLAWTCPILLLSYEKLEFLFLPDIQVSPQVLTCKPDGEVNQWNQSKYDKRLPTNHNMAMKVTDIKH